MRPPVSARATAVCGTAVYKRASQQGPMASSVVAKVHPYRGRCSRDGALIHDRLGGLLAEQRPPSRSPTSESQKE